MLTFLFGFIVGVITVFAFAAVMASEEGRWWE